MYTQPPVRATAALDFPISSLRGLKSLAWYYGSDNELGGFRADLLADLVAPVEVAAAQNTHTKTPLSSVAERIFGNAIIRLPIFAIGPQCATPSTPFDRKKHVRIATLGHLQYLLDNAPIDADPAVLRSLRVITSELVKSAFAPLDSGVKRALAPTPREDKQLTTPSVSQHEIVFLQAPPIRLASVKRDSSLADVIISKREQASAALLVTTPPPREEISPSAEPRTTYQITRRYMREEDDPILFKIFADLLYRAADSADWQAGIDYQTRQTKSGVAVRLFEDAKAKELVRNVYRLAKKILAAIEAKEIANG